MTANMMHLLRLTFRFQLSSGKTILSAAFRVNLESACEFQKRSQFFICAHNETLSIHAVKLTLESIEVPFLRRIDEHFFALQTIFGVLHVRCGNVCLNTRFFAQLT